MKAFLYLISLFWLTIGITALKGHIPPRMPVYSLKKLLQPHTLTPFSVLQGRGGVYSGFRNSGWVECVVGG